MRIPLATDYKTRTGAPDKDARQRNSYIEVKGDQAVVRKRPAIQVVSQVGTGIAQGGFCHFFMYGDVLYNFAVEWGSSAALKENVTLSNSNRTAVADLVADEEAGGQVLATISMNHGKWYWECKVNAQGSIYGAYIGVIDNIYERYPGAGVLGTSNNGWALITKFPSFTGCLRYATVNDVLIYNGAPEYGSSFGDSDVIGIALNMSDGEMTFYKNNVSMGVAFTGIIGNVTPACQPNFTSVTANFLREHLVYSPPAGYLCIGDTECD